MSFRVLADENVDHRVVHRLVNYGHDIEHVDFVSELGKGSTDARIAQYSRTDERLLLTSDDDFLTDFDEDDYFGLLDIEDESLSAQTIADIIHPVANFVQQDQLPGIIYVSPNWLGPF